MLHACGAQLWEWVDQAYPSLLPRRILYLSKSRRFDIMAAKAAVPYLQRFSIQGRAEEAKSQGSHRPARDVMT